MFDPAPAPRLASRAIPAPAPTQGTLLLVDDELMVVNAYARALRANGFRVLTAHDGETAEVMFRKCGVDAVVTDISMPGMDGLQLLQALRRIDPDVPVIMATGDHRHQSTGRAVDEGALMYLVKPVDLRTLTQLVGHATQLHRRATAQRAVQIPTIEPTPRASASADEGLAVRFESAVEKLWIAYQPIVHWATGVAVGYEALVRSHEPSIADPGALFGAAARLDRTLDLCRAIRAGIAADLPAAPKDVRIFVNLHSAELDDDAFFAASEPLRPFADRVVLEIAERDSLHRVTSLTSRLDRLRDAGFRIAVDDLGAGYAGLGLFAQLKPSVVKLDICLVREIDKDPVKQKIVEAMAIVCRDMGVEIVAEGVETEEERQTLGRLGCHLHQGFAYGVPRRGFGRGPGA